MTDPVAVMSVPAHHPVFEGHFPGRPIVPGVMLLEWALDEAGNRLNRSASGLRIRECKFIEPLLPAETATLFLNIDGNRCSFRVQRGNAVLATGVIELS